MDIEGMAKSDTEHLVTTWGYAILLFAASRQQGSGLL